MAIIGLLRVTLHPSVILHHSPNGGRRSAREGARFKALGVLPGWPDLTLIWEHPTSAGSITAFLELKAGRNKLSDEQKAFKERATALGCLYAEARTLGEAVEALRRWHCPMRALRASCEALESAR